WDKLHPGKSHSLLIQKLHEIGLSSLYHKQADEAQGEEIQPTQYMYRNPEKGYHIDFAFIEKSLLSKARLTIGAPDEWLKYSDHMPLIIDTE
ncbi:MAG: endonuclease/exonuclease/phosphatase family protein, partial [bacterium]|nr:endonuclease/exonuclease/phosphatase family protein [bacterium]